jgi:hypothetical protein
MARKTIEARGSARLTQTTAEAAAILAGDLAACSRMLRFYIDAAVLTDDEDVRADYAKSATDLAGAVAKLSASLAQMRGETRHRISVARASEDVEDALQMHPNAP